MKAKVDPDLCSGCGLCEGVCPDVFEMNDEAVARVKMEVIPSEAEESCRDAAEQCPCEAIIIDES